MTTQTTRRGFLAAIGAGLLRAAPERKPNVIFLLGDDMGIDLFSCYGSDQYKTPNIDALAAGGVKFDYCHSTPLCGPSRCLLMTGRYGFRTGGVTNESWRHGVGAQSKNEIPIAKVMKSAGYATCSAGKWRQVGEKPSDWGFDEYITDQTASGWYWERIFEKNGKPLEFEKEEYGPDVEHDFAIDFMRRNREKPFFLYYPTHLVHSPTVRTPDTKGEGKDLFADNVTYIDKLIGKVVAEVDRLGLRENTVLVFSGDNGTLKGKMSTIGGRLMTGGKGTMLEGGARVPLIVNWKGQTPKGRVVHDLVDFSDFLPSFAEFGRAKLPSGVKIDGRSFAPQSLGQKGQPREWAYVQLGPDFYAKDHNWKLNQSGELFDMKKAPFEEKLVAAEGAPPEAVQARARLQKVLDELNPLGGIRDDQNTPEHAARRAEKKTKKAQKQ